MGPKKKAGQKAADNAKQRVEQKLLKVREERLNIQACRKAVSSVSSGNFAPDGGCMMQRGVMAVETAFAEIEQCIAKLKKECLEAVNDVVLNSQEHLVSVEQRLETLEQSMLQVGKNTMASQAKHRWQKKVYWQTKPNKVLMAKLSKFGLWGFPTPS